MPPRARRTDAVDNRARIVAAARAALAESNGAIDVKLHLIAKAAGVGQGTLYRNFPTREHLLAEAYRDEVRDLVDAVPELLQAHAPLEALTLWLGRVADYARVKRGVIAAIEASAWQELYTDQHDRLDRALDDLLARGRESGQVRSGVDAADVILLLGGLSRIPADQWTARAPTLIAVIVDGLRRR